MWRFVVSDFPKTFEDDHERWMFEEIQEIKRGPLELMHVRKPAFKDDTEAHFQILECMLSDHKFLLTETPSPPSRTSTFGAICSLRYSGNEIPQEFKRLRPWYHSIEGI